MRFSPLIVNLLFKNKELSKCVNSLFRDNEVPTNCACVSWFKTWCLEIKLMWMHIECLCGTNPHRFYLWTPLLSQNTHAQWNRKSQNLGLLKWIFPELRVLALTKRHVGSGKEIVFRRIRNQTATHAQKGDKCPLSSHGTYWKHKILSPLHNEWTHSW